MRPVEGEGGPASQPLSLDANPQTSARGIDSTSRQIVGLFLTISWTQLSDAMSRDITRVHQIRSLTRPIHLPERRQSIGVDGFWSILLKHRWHEACPSSEQAIQFSYDWIPVVGHILVPSLTLKTLTRVHVAGGLLR